MKPPSGGFFIFCITRISTYTSSSLWWFSMRSVPLTSILLAAAVVCGFIFTSESTVLALFGCILLSGVAAFAATFQPLRVTSPGRIVVAGYLAIFGVALIAGVLPSKYPYLSFVCGAAYGALAVGCALGFAIRPGTSAFFSWAVFPAGLWVSIITIGALLGQNRAHQLFQDSNTYATLLNIVFVLAVGYLSRPSAHRIARGFATLIALFAVVNMYLVHSKGAWLALLATLVMLALVARKALALNWRHYLAIAVLAVVAASSIYSRVSVERHEHRDGRSTSSRMAMLKGTIEIIKKYPAGVGIGQWFRAYEEVRTGDDVESSGLHAHADYFEIVAEAGPFGLPLLLFPGILALYQAMQLRRLDNTRDARQRAALIAVVSVCAGQAIVNYTFQQTGINLVVGLACGLLLQHVAAAPAGRLHGRVRVAIAAVFIAFVAVVTLLGAAFATPAAQQGPDEFTSKALPWLKDERTLLALSRLVPFDVRPKVSYATYHQRIAVNRTLSSETRIHSYRTSMKMYLELNKQVPGDFQILVTAGSLALHVGAEFDKSALALAEALLRRAYALAPSNTGVALPYAQALFARGRFEEAEAVVAATLLKAPHINKPVLEQALKDIRRNQPK